MSKSATKSTVKKPVEAEAKKLAPAKEITEKQLTRMVVEVPTESVQSFKVLCDLLGTTQGVLVSKALNKYISDNQALVDQFLSLRTQVSQSINK